MRQGWQFTPRFWDRVAGWLITGGGIGLILAVLAILLFIMKEAAPLAGRAHVSETSESDVLGGDIALAAGVDEYREVAFVVQPHGTVFYALRDGSVVERFSPPDETGRLVAATYDPRSGLLVTGTSDGRAAISSIDFSERWSDAGRTIVPQRRTHATVRLDSLNGALTQVVGARDEDGAIALAAVTASGALRYAYVDEEGELLTRASLEAELAGRAPTSIALALEAGLLAVGTDDGTLYFWKLDDPESPVLEDHVNAAESSIAAVQLLLGDQTLIVASDDGAIAAWFRVRYVRIKNEGSESIDVEGVEIGPNASRVFLDRGYGERYANRPEIRIQTAGQPWTRIRSFNVHREGVRRIAVSPRDKGFSSIDASGRMALHHLTSGRTLKVVDTTVGDARSLVFAPRADALLVAGHSGRLHVWRVDNAHPEAGARALFAKVWYEGYSQPEHVWQSTGGTQEFEPKLGLVPLFVGTLKGTLYAMVFSIPLSILGALYLSQLATPAMRNVVKPIVELMAAVPSVVVGFLAALWLAPLLEANMAPILGTVLLVPAALAVAISVWMLLPSAWRQSARPGTELFFMLPFLAFAIWVGSTLGGPLEGWLFGGDLKQWLYDGFGVRYDQRNSIVVGIALGFAVIPIIFSICEDAMSSVPPSLTSAAFALGASRWQTALHVILPAASPGIFAAVMLGLGRAIGETMIVLMATGNTPILDLSPFNGMRTMSAAIAVEIPEAPHGGTLYRVLFLTGTLLFMFTFLINTGADLISRRLRKRYAQF